MYNIFRAELWMLLSSVCIQSFTGFALTFHVASDP